MSPGALKSPKPGTTEKDDLSKKLLGIAASSAVEAGQYLRENFKAGTETQEKAGYFDLLTVYDSLAEELITDRLFSGHSDSQVIGEETAPKGSGSVIWYVDPIDGTTNYASGFPFYCISIGAVVDGETLAGVVYDPQREELFEADLGGARLNGCAISVSDARPEKDSLCLVSWPYEGHNSGLDEESIERDMVANLRALRRMGSAALSLAYVAAGRANMASELIAKPWDVAAGFLLVEQAGGEISKAPAVGELPPPAIGEWLAPRYVAHARNFDVAGSSLGAILR